MKATTPILLLLFLLFSCFSVAGNTGKKDSLIHFINQPQPDSLKIKALLQLSAELKKSNSMQAALYATQALKLSEINSLPQSIAKANSLIGDISRIGSNYTRAREYYMKALELYKSLNDSIGMSSAINYIGMMYANQGAYPDALKYYYMSLELNERMNDKSAIAISYNNIGNINDLLGNYDEALNFHFRSLKLKEEMKNYSGIANTLNNIGEIYKKQGKYDEAMDYYSRSLKLKKELKFIPGIANTLNNIGDVFLLKKEYYQSLSYYNQSLELLDSLDDKEGRAIVNNNIGILFFMMKQYARAADYLRKGLSLASEIGLMEEQRKAYLALANVYEAQGNYKLANEYIKQNSFIKDSLLNEKNTRLISEMQAKYESEENKKEIDLLTKEKYLQQLEIYNGRITTTSVSIGCLLLLVLVLVFLYAYKQKQKANLLLMTQNQDITKQKEEKELLLKEIHHRVKNNLQIINSLLRLQSHQVEDERSLSLFEECQNRILSMAIIHEKLYKSQDLANIDTKSYIETLSESLLRSYRTNKDVSIKVICKVSSVGIDTLMPLGLILNEIISNSLKYAFTGRSNGKITILLDRSSDTTYEMMIGDNGVGLPADFSWENSTTLGIELIKTLVDQINGTIDKVKDAPGTAFKISFTDITK